MPKIEKSHNFDHLMFCSETENEKIVDNIQQCFATSQNSNFLNIKVDSLKPS